MKNIAAQIARLQRMTPKELREQYLTEYGEPSRSGNKSYLLKRVAWRMQSNAEGDLPERARKRAAELARDSDLRLNPPRPVEHRDEPYVSAPQPGLPMPGAMLRRDYKGRTILVTVLEKGFEFEGESFRSLSAIAKHITGSHWNGRLFFGFTGKEQS